MKHVISGVEKFQKEIYPHKQTKFKKLASGQNPEVLFITCSDSRIDPNLITQSDPGDLFICRNAGNIVPPHSNNTGGMTASIEFAVAVLCVTDIIICGHTDCGAMKGALDTSALDELPHVKEWLGHARIATEVVKERCGCLGVEQLEALTEENVVQQMQHLRTHPAVAAKLATKQVRLHGWMYDIEKGDVYCYNAETSAFEPMAELYAQQSQE